MSLTTSVIVAILLLCNGLASLAQENPPSPQSQSTPREAYGGSKESLKSFLEELLAATKAGDRVEVSALIKKTEIPNDRNWFLSMYPEDKAESWIYLYESDLPRYEIALQKFFEGLADSEGQFIIRRQSEETQPGHSLVWDVLGHPNPSPETYLATWKSVSGPGSGQASSLDPRPKFIGFFYFIDGAFRWNSVARLDPSKRATGSPSVTSDKSESEPPGKVSGVSAPKPIHSVDAEYSQEAREARLQGSVIVTLVVDASGKPQNIRVTRSLGLGLDENAVEAARKYTFVPAKRDGKPVPVMISLEFRFRL